ncbi:hypothetical protein I350_02373 [Cryptococcus amylolentus CBS 6273]|uniref:Histone-lysine N-methyltransferase, H3 lysine-4 specific n=1 Tax=Cryptococcus amylolentus CBS 6273 TaxID=1296118 RepID=A0A1E3KAX3_9TREE|nr:hypothetical protein I350_02373 [Cryptococcus amylolentus CBS 6273]
MAHGNHHHSSSSSANPDKYTTLDSQSRSRRDSLPQSSSSSQNGMLGRTESEKISIAFPSSSRGKRSDDNARRSTAGDPESFASRLGALPSSSRNGRSPSRDSQRRFEERGTRETEHGGSRRSAAFEDSRSDGRRGSANSRYGYSESGASRDYRENRDRDRRHESSSYREDDRMRDRRYSRESDRDRGHRVEFGDRGHYRSSDRHGERHRDGERGWGKDHRRDREDERRPRERDARERDSERGDESRGSGRERSRRDSVHKERTRERGDGPPQDDLGRSEEQGRGEDEEKPRDQQRDQSKDRRDSRGWGQSSRHGESDREASSSKERRASQFHKPPSPPSNRWVARQKAEDPSTDKIKATGLLANEESRPKIHIPLTGNASSQSFKTIRPPPPHIEAKLSIPRPPSPGQRPPTPTRPPSSPAKPSIPLAGAPPTPPKTLVRPVRPIPSGPATFSGLPNQRRTTSLSSSTQSRPVTPPLPLVPSAVASVAPSLTGKEDAPPPPSETAPPVPERSPSPSPPPIKIPFQSSTLSGLTSLSRANNPEKKANGGSEMPPSFHFRPLPVPAFPKETSSEASSPALEVPAPRPAALAERAPEASWVCPPYVAPACVKHRPGTGNFLVFKDADGKEQKRLDGMIDGKVVEVVDPRKDLSKEQLARGRGSAKQRDEFHEVNFQASDLPYQWDSNSTGPAPPPPPAAVLITGLSPLTTVDQITKYLRPHGRIKELDSKVNPKTGMQLGICWVKFDSPPSGKPGTANDVASSVVKMCDGKRISNNGNEKIKVVLDGRGLRTAKAVKEEMERLYPPKKAVDIPLEGNKPTPTPATAPTSTPTPSSQVASTPARLTSANGVGTVGNHTPVARPGPTTALNGKTIYTKPLGQGFQGGFQAQRFGSNAPYNDRFNNNQSQHRPFGHANLRHLGPYAPGGARNPLPRPLQQPVQHLESSFTSAPFEKHGASADRGRALNGRSSRDRSLTLTSSESDSDDDRRPGRRGLSPYGQGGVSKSGPSPEDEERLAKIREQIKENGKPYIFVISQGLPTTASYEGFLGDHFKLFKPAKILQAHLGWYILFPEDNAAAQAKRVLDGTLVQGRTINLAVQTSGPRVTQPLTAPADAPDRMSALASVPTGDPTWKKMTIAKKNRPAVRKVEKERLKPVKKLRPVDSSSSEDEEAPASVAALKSKVKRDVNYSSDSSTSEDDTPISRGKLSTKSIVKVKKESEPVVEEIPIGDVTSADAIKHSAKSKKLQIDSEDEDEIPLSTKVASTKKRPAPAKGKKANKKARIEPDGAESMDVDMPPPPPKKKKPTKTEVDKFIASGALVDEEDAYWLGQVLAAQEAGVEPVFSDDEEIRVEEAHPLYHRSGSWRAEGWKKIPQVQKSRYLPQRNRAAVASEDNSVTTGRTARLAGRDQHRQTAAVAANQTVESDLFAFNQLRIRKKQLRFARSAIEGYGLYAMETIHVGEMVCEYVGDLIRATVADVREQVYLKQGIGSSYLFRIDNDIVCDATFKGSVSRLINHSCDPSANAKIIKVNGQSKIVIYAERTLYPGEEILYDYKFPLEDDPALRVPCLCGAATCRGWLN